MKIAVNLFLASPKSVTGAFVYIQNILPALSRAGKENIYFLLGHQETIDYFKTLFKDFSNIRYRVFDIRRDIFTNPLNAFGKLLARIKNDYRAREDIIAQEVQTFLRKNNITVYFSPTQTIFPMNLRGVKHITTILDLQFEYFPENFPASYLEKRRRDARHAINHSDSLIAISKYTKKSLIENYDARPEKIKVIYFAPHEIKNTPPTVTLPQEFIFYPAAIWPHKNHLVLIKALSTLKDRFPSLHAVCAGIVKNKDLKDALEHAAELGGIAGRVFFPGYMSGGNLRSMYAHAKALVFPSAFEGFGIPLIEAMRFGLPVVAADNSSITEVVDGAGILVETGSAEMLAAAIEKVLIDSTLRNTLIKQGRERAAMFSWETAAEETLITFQE